MLLSPDDFAELKDSAAVSFRIGVAEEKEKLKRQFAEVTADRIAGKSLGKLDKKMIDRQPVIDRKLNEKL